MKLELLQDKTKEEIGDIWRRYHADKDSVAAVIPAVVFSQMEQRFKLFKLVSSKAKEKSWFGKDPIALLVVSSSPAS